MLPRSRIAAAEETVPFHIDYWFMMDDDVDENVAVLNSREKISKAFEAESIVAERILKHVEKWGSKETHPDSGSGTIDSSSGRRNADATE